MNKFQNLAKKQNILRRVFQGSRGVFTKIHNKYLSEKVEKSVKANKKLTKDNLCEIILQENL